jgi:hypothetical protein
VPARDSAETIPRTLARPQAQVTTFDYGSSSSTRLARRHAGLVSAAGGRRRVEVQDPSGPAAALSAWPESNILRRPIQTAAAVLDRQSRQGFCNPTEREPLAGRIRVLPLSMFASACSSSALMRDSRSLAAGCGLVKCCTSGQCRSDRGQTAAYGAGSGGRSRSAPASSAGGKCLNARSHPTPGAGAVDATRTGKSTKFEDLVRDPKSSAAVGISADGDPPPDPRNP